MQNLRGSNIFTRSFMPSVEENTWKVAGMKEENQKISVCRGSLGDKP